MLDSSIIPTKIVGGAIAIYENIWPNSLEIISHCSSEKNVKFVPATVLDAKTGKTYINNVRNTDSIGITKNKEIDSYFKELDESCRGLVNSVVNSYKKLFKISEEILDKENYSLLRYNPGQYYHQHYDGGTESARSISVLIYLNDEYSGGEIEFVNFNEKFKPKAGTLILFPSNYAYGHIAHPVTSGTKYVIVTWLHDR